MGFAACFAAESAFALGTSRAIGCAQELRTGGPMLETIIVLAVLLWLLGMVSSYTIGGLIHILLVVAVVVLLIRVIQGRRVV
jgi:hypothetical protein